MQRRPSYGPTSPLVGERGARTRERIIAESLGLFARLGFREATVRDISEASQISRAALYQYFESKEEIFVELLDECGGALLTVMRQIGPLGPSAEGFENLLTWLLEWSDIYERYGTLFVQWSRVDLPGTAVRTLVSGFLGSYNRRIANRFRLSGLRGLNPAHAAIVTTSVIHRLNYLRFMAPSDPLNTEAAVRDIATALQLMLFPDTPAAVVRDSTPPRACQHPTPTFRAEVGHRRAKRFDGLTVRSAATVDRMLEAGARCITQSGYHQANVDHIVRLAGFARGTFYKYFNEKLDLLLALSARCEVELSERIFAFSQIPADPSGGAARRIWLTDFLDFREVYVGVIRTWIDRTPSHPELD
ncbi:MAG: transcriptional regulator, TetR family, partial [Mycobacterium sp.]|nr:transcriptional regulator, TetR family [Mycobacterium sp.]